MKEPPMSEPTPDETLPAHFAGDTFVSSELVSESDSFLSLGVRRVLYLAGLAGAALAPVLAVTHPEYAAGIVAGSGVLTAAALGTALANPSR
jgi:hypothetical protein